LISIFILTSSSALELIFLFWPLVAPLSKI
jgi:hypothetical protein